MTLVNTFTGQLGTCPRATRRKDWGEILSGLRSYVCLFIRVFPTQRRASLGIGCAGEIRIGQHEDYDKWTIDILVKFRDDEKLQLLTSQRQSGGVRHLRMNNKTC